MEKYKVFISSTIDDLLEARSEAERHLLALEVFEPIRIEKFPANEQPSRVVCLGEVHQSDAVLLLIGDRYGFVPSDNNPQSLSVTHLEFREARRLQRPIFAFVKESTVREHQQNAFVAEIEDFNSGIFRKTWASVDELEQQIKRTLLWWLVRRARGAESHTIPFEKVQHQLRAEGLTDVRFTIETLILGDTASSWVRQAMTAVSQSATRNLLPVPTEVESPQALGDEHTQILVRALPSEVKQSHMRLELWTHQLEDTDAVSVSVNAKPKTRLCFIEVEESEDGSEVFQSLVKAVLFLIAEDHGRCINLLLELSARNSIDEISKDQLLKTAGHINISSKLEYIFAISEQILSLDKPSFETINVAIHGLMAIAAKSSATGLEHASQAASQALCQLYQKGLSTGVSGAEALYSLAKQLSGNMPRLAEALYKNLIQVHPFYDERWYWHRDMGLLSYHQNKFSSAAIHYDNASRLKPDDSELCRFAGDAYFYQGHWMEALTRYQMALALEPVEVYFLDEKIEFCRSKLRHRIQEDKFWRLRRYLSYQISRRASTLADWNFRVIPAFLFRYALRICPLDFDAAKWLALFANEKGDYNTAIRLLGICLSAMPENYSARLNLTLNLIFREGGRWTDLARKHAKAAIFHAGRSAKERFRICLLNTASRDDLIKTFDEVLCEEVKNDREGWTQRRREVLKPQKFGEVLHVEFRP